MARLGSEILFSGKGSLFLGDNNNNWICVAYAGNFELSGSIEHSKIARSYDYIPDRSIKTKEEYSLKFSSRTYILPILFQILGYTTKQDKQYKGLIKSVSFDNNGQAVITNNELNGAVIEKVLALTDDNTYPFSWYEITTFVLISNQLTITEITLANKTARIHLIYSKNNSNLITTSTFEKEVKILLNTQLDQTQKAISLYIPRAKLTKPITFKGLGEPFEAFDLEFEVLLDNNGKPFYLGDIFSWINE
ncbi:MAG: hypothetical protein ABIL89_02065 [candidate division WOR-3 bacterium]